MQDTTERMCIVCGRGFTVGPQQGRKQTYSPDCQRQRHLDRQRRWAASRYKPAPALPARQCEFCGTSYSPRRSDQRDCSTLCNRRRNNRNKQAILRPADRPQTCHKCGIAVLDRKPGVRVCDECRVDPRKNRIENEARRRLKTYGLTQDEYDALWRSQDERCALCRTDTPTSKGWCIDHCHDTGRVRGILCGPCNSALGHFRDDPTAMRRAAAYVEAT